MFDICFSISKLVFSEGKDTVCATKFLCSTFYQFLNTKLSIHCCSTITPGNTELPFQPGPRHVSCLLYTSLIGLPYAITIGAAVCVLGIIPYLGIITAFIPAVLLAWFTYIVKNNP